MDPIRIKWIFAAVVGLLLSGCAGIQTAPTQEERQALAPTGKLRVAFLSTSPLYAKKDAASGELKGVAVDLGKELARRIGVPFEAVGYFSISAQLAGAKSGEWDVAMMAINAQRALIVDFTAPYMEVEFSYLVPGGSSMSTLSDVDKPGVRIGVVQKGGPDVGLSRTLQSATLFRVPTLADMSEALKTGRADALAASKASLLSMSAKIPGSRVLEGRFSTTGIGMAVPKGRTAAAAYVRKFVEEAKSEGLVKDAIERAELRGVIVAPLR